MEIYEPKPATDSEGKPRFDAKHFLSETVRLADRTTCALMNVANAGSAKPRDLLAIADAYRHAANRVTTIAEDLVEKSNALKEAGQ
jgi:hypothetical protein